jgi:hypothetical protein
MLKEAGNFWAVGLNAPKGTVITQKNKFTSVTVRLVFQDF